MTNREKLTIAGLISRAADKMLQDHTTSCCNCYVLDSGEGWASKNCVTGSLLDRVASAALRARLTLDREDFDARRAGREVPA